MLELRRYRDDDAASVWRLHDEGLRQMGVHAGDGPWDDDVRSVAATYLADRGEFLVGVVAGEGGGNGRAATGVQHRGGGQADARRCRLPAARVRSRGAAWSRSSCRELGYRRLRLDTTVKQVPAERLYRGDGYVEVERARDRAGEAVIFFEKRLA
ncbi:MAG TPA: hypothetical protein VK631_10890 [Solirubrobacteraceae bacterium]|nr:hypothetical protein [Solirubrobacteraceae bacterium]